MRTPKHGLYALLAVVFLFGFGIKNVFAQEVPANVSYVPLIGITSVPEPLALPDGAGSVTYHYAVKNFLQEAPLTDVVVVDETCGQVTYTEGDDNGDGRLDYSETWRYACTTTLSETTQSTATATGNANDLTATHTAHTTVVIGSKNLPPLVSIINVTKVAYPLSLPIDGGDITFTYKVNNPGLVPLSGVTATDDKCHAMSGKLGDTNYNSLLDINEVWIYTCTAYLTQTTTNTVNVTAFANGLKAVAYAAITVKVESKVESPVPNFPDLSLPSVPEGAISPHLKIAVWGMLSAVLASFLIFFFFTRKSHPLKKSRKKRHSMLKGLLIMVLSVGVLGAGIYFFSVSDESAVTPYSNDIFGWKYPSAKFPTTGSYQLAYSDIRDPGGIPQGLPVRLKIPAIGVNSAIEDALITPDGRMDVPAGSKNVAWFSLGPHPGKEGSAVIGGHYGITDGVPFVFYKLDQLKTGDKIYIEDDSGNTLAFIVRFVRLFDRDADPTTVFTSDDGLAHLNLITCEGVWNRVNDSYPDRRVVFTDAIPTEGAVTVPNVIAAPSRSLALGARGADVVALQTALEQKGFLIMPRGVAKGYFGTLTRSAVIKYQTSVGLPRLGVFNAATKAKLMPVQPPVAVKPILPTTAIIPTEPTPVPTFSQQLLRTVKSFYATPLDGLITALLVIGTLLVALKLLGRYKKIPKPRK
ncbi:MAG: sortase [Patescibacteria group bacterium]|jgi:LPXTG-site transpeptidase (sortase) family protein